MSDRNTKKYALVLGGGGVRGAWTSGFLKYILENWGHRFDTVSGSSAGALNGYSYISNIHDPDLAAKKITETWASAKFSNMAKWVWGNALLRSGLFSIQPLQDYLNEKISNESYRKNMDSGLVKTFIIPTVNITKGKSHLWIDSNERKDYSSGQWNYEYAKINTDHAVASSAVFGAFTPRKIGESNDLHADGSTILNTPILPSILSLIDSRDCPQVDEPELNVMVLFLEGNLEKIYGESFIDYCFRLFEVIQTYYLEQDIEKVNIINRFIDKLGLVTLGKYRKVNLCVIKPSRILTDISVDIKNKTWWKRVLIPDLLTKYSAFLNTDSEHIAALIDAGYNDAASMHDQLDKFFNHEAP